jgi:micrococcal nuclease
MYLYKIKNIDVYDGDTISGTVDLGFDISIDIKVRLKGINAPEIRTRDKKEKKKGYESRDFLRKIVEKYKDVIRIKTVKKGKYGRWLGELLIDIDDVDNHDDDLYKSERSDGYYCINTLMVKEKHAIYKDY